MSSAYYRLLLASAASLSLALAGCGGGRTSYPPAAPGAQKAAADESDELDTEATIWTVLGIAKERPRHEPGPKTGAAVSPVLYQAALDTFNFTKFETQDPVTGALTTEWYSPPGKPDERFKANILILSRVLHSDSVAVIVRRQQRNADGVWADTTIDKSVPEHLQAAILTRARQLRQAWAPPK